MPQDRNQSQIYLWLPRVSSYYNIQRINKSHCLFSQHFFSIGTCFFSDLFHMCVEIYTPSNLQVKFNQLCEQVATELRVFTDII